MKLLGGIGWGGIGCRWRYLVGLAAVLGVVLAAIGETAADTFSTIERVKASVVAVGTFQPTRAPAFQFLATGFAVGDGSLIATNAHVLPPLLDSERRESLAILIPAANGEQPQIREAQRVAVDAGSDLALVKITGRPIPALKIRAADNIREGQNILFTGFPIGNVLGPYAATHRGIVAAITPIAIPPPTSGELDARVVRRLSTGPYPVLQLDATAYPGNSGSPVYDPESGEVLGIVNMVFVKGTKESVLTQPSGITYAIPSARLQELLQKAR